MKPLVFSTEPYDYLLERLQMFAECSPGSWKADKTYPPALPKNSRRPNRLFEIGQVERKKFPDGERYRRFIDDLSGRDVIVIGGTHDDSAIVELYHLAAGAVMCGAQTMTVVIPYYGYSTMERRSLAQRGEIVSAKIFAEMLSSIRPAPGGNCILLFDLHSGGMEHYFEGAVRSEQVYGMPVVTEAIYHLAGGKPRNVVLGGTDAGRAPWVLALAENQKLRVKGVPMDVALVYQRRLSGKKKEVIGVDPGDIDGRGVIIYDDMGRTLGSVINAATIYRKAGAPWVRVILSHGVLPGFSLAKLRRRRINCGPLVDKVLCLDTHPRVIALHETGRYDGFLEVWSAVSELGKELFPQLRQHR